MYRSNDPQFWAACSAVRMKCICGASWKSADKIKLSSAEQREGEHVGKARRAGLAAPAAIRRAGGRSRSPGDAADRGCPALPLWWSPLPPGTTVALSVADGRMTRSLVRPGVLFVISKDRLMYFKQTGRPRRCSQKVLAIFFLRWFSAPVERTDKMQKYISLEITRMRLYPGLSSLNI